MEFLKKHPRIVAKGKVDGDELTGTVKLVGTADGLTSLSCKIVQEC